MSAQPTPVDPVEATVASLQLLEAGVGRRVFREAITNFLEDDKLTIVDRESMDEFFANYGKLSEALLELEPHIPSKSGAQVTLDDFLPNLPK